MLNNAALRKNARMQLKGNWGKPILVGVLYLLFVIAISLISFFGAKTNSHGLFTLAIIIVTSLVSGPIMIGLNIFSLKFKRGEQPGVGTVFKGFKPFWPSVGIYWWYKLWVYLWTLLLIIPGIVKSLSYSMSFYILADNPNVGVRNALKMSKKMMKGYKGKLFLLGLSFIGWGLLSVITLGIGFLWLVPYIRITAANFYHELKNESIEKGICLAEEF